MKIALIADSYRPETGGPSEILKETKSALKKKNIKISIFTNDEFKKKNYLLKKKIEKFDICHLYGVWTFFHIKTFLIAY